jgi:hypothetical protein
LEVHSALEKEKTSRLLFLHMIDMGILASAGRWYGGIQTEKLQVMLLLKHL